MRSNFTDWDAESIRWFRKENPWLTRAWFEKNKAKLESYFDCALTFELAIKGIMEEPRIDWFLEYLETNLAYSYDCSVQSN